MRDTFLDLKVKAITPVKRLISPVSLASANHRLADGRRVICSARRNQISQAITVEWFIDQTPVTETIARVALARG